ncbi:hypothetical protein IWW36_000148 [Coemansia brasiliensis]|uniref:tRNA (cytosine(38)-C(5))-methyltransferase n=1 Tax=Coemansia brasiliensis TaxID=2650707 RepID=A0A9W8IBJ2_9FUNG|nr:hypothetical protein IWW36_000148 [Coemansia brasiliensis]
MSDSSSEPIVCLEFFSGIGGLHYSFLECGVEGKVAMSFDMNELANTVYEHNFGMRPNNKAIDYLEPRDIEKYNATCWLLSPPCQPYTRGGKYGDINDPRARGLLHLLKLLPQLQKPPRYVLLENVMNFENSQSRSFLVETLGHLGFEINECLLSPVQFGIPNNRLRYYLVARQMEPPRDDSMSLQLQQQTREYLARGKDVVFTEWPFGLASKTINPANIHHMPLKRYIMPEYDLADDLLVPKPHILKRKQLHFDIVRPASDKTSTFTKAYGSKHLIGSGSLLQTQRLDVKEDGYGSPEKLINLGLRFFSPTEVAMLHHFPLSKDAKYKLEFPEGITQRQQLQLLGNSLNVHVVAQLLRHILFG